MSWQRTDGSSVMTDWVGDTLVMYVVARESEGKGHWVAQRRVAGASSRVSTLGAASKREVAEQLADQDLADVQAKGF
jgi:hypothetical protein